MSVESEVLENAAVESAASNPWTFIIIVSVAAAALVCIAFFLFIRRKSEKPFSLLQEKQVTLDVLDGPALFNWAREAQIGPASERVVAYANRRWITRLGYQYPDDLDEQHNVVAFVVDQTDGKASHECLFSFSEMSANVKKLFGKEDCFFLKD